MIITISGKPGSGKTTVGTMLAEHLGFEEYDIGILRREMARKRGMTIGEYNKLGETDPSTDTEADEYQRELGLEKDNFVIQGRTSFHFIPHSVKIFLDVDEKVGAERIWKDLQADADKRNEGKYSSVEELIEGTRVRIASDNKRFHEYYDGLDIFDKNHYDLWLDTSNITQKEVMQLILDHIEAAKVDKK